MGLLRLANDETTRLPIGDSPEDWIEVRKDISKRTFNKVALAMPDVPEGGTVTLAQGLDLQTLLFDTLVTGWSLDVPATIENYLLLEREAGTLIDTAVSEYFSTLTPNREENSKSKGPRKADGGGS